MKNKVYKILKDIKQLMEEILDEKFDVLHYGAYDINPKNLVIWICVETDTTKEKLSNNFELNKRLRNILTKNEYPLEAIDDIIGFESQETVDRESNGDWYLHFK